MTVLLSTVKVSDLQALADVFAERGDIKNIDQLVEALQKKAPGFASVIKLAEPIVKAKFEEFKKDLGPEGIALFDKVPLFDYSQGKCIVF